MTIDLMTAGDAKRISLEYMRKDMPNKAKHLEDAAKGGLMYCTFDKLNEEEVRIFEKWGYKVTLPHGFNQGTACIVSWKDVKEAP